MFDALVVMTVISGGILVLIARLPGARWPIRLLVAGLGVCIVAYGLWVHTQTGTVTFSFGIIALSFLLLFSVAKGVAEGMKSRREARKNVSASN